MAQDKLAKRNAETLTFQRQPQEFLAQLGSRMDTLQKVYRTKLPPDELVVWRESLKEFSVQEFDAAVTEMVKHPPRYELDDGTIQVWRGMPKLPDVIQTMLVLREQRAAEYRRQEAAIEAAKMRELGRLREAHPEKFFGWADFLKEWREKLGNAMPKAEIDLDKNRAKLEQQKKDLGIS